MTDMLDDTDRAIIDALQEGFPISPRPFAEAAEALGLEEGELIARLKALRETNVLTRFGPMVNADRFGGHNTLAAMPVPTDSFEWVAQVVNSFPEVAHNYARDHALNMWFVVAAESRRRVGEVLAEIQARTGIAVYDMPKIREFHIGLRIKA